MDTITAPGISLALSEKDRALLTLLAEDGRAPVSALAAKLNLSRGTVQKRLDRLQDIGVIQGYTVVLSPDYLAEQIKAHVLITVDPKATEAVIAAMQKIGAVRDVYSVSGAYDLVAILAAGSVRELDRAIDAVIGVEGVERTVSSVILATRFERGAPTRTA
ncbi:MAG: Lrp/AsnC family transcriptional regulator [Pseudomonadota bacterium]